ncbi:MAG: toll/interleukin-1 receptor domain-containing protein [Rubrivivax sp.]
MHKLQLLLGGHDHSNTEFFLTALDETVSNLNGVTVLDYKVCDVTLQRSDRISSTDHFLQSIQEAIQAADVIIADLSTRSPALMMEIGIAQALGKHVLYLAQDGDDIPVGLRQLPILLYQSQAPRSNTVSRLFKYLHSFLFPPPPSDIESDSTSDVRNEVARRRVFVSYCHEDVAFLQRILVHLRPAEREGSIDLWSDTNLQPGAKWREEIRRNLNAARIAILLVSADFLASDFIASDELPPLLAAAEEGGCRILPVVLKPSRFLRDQRLACFQAVSDPNFPIAAMNEWEREAIFAKLAELIEIELGSL